MAAALGLPAERVKARQQAQHIREIIACPCALRKHHRGVFKNGVVANVETLLLKIGNCASQSGSLVRIIEDMPAGNRLCVERSNSKHVIQPVVVGMVLYPIKGGLNSKKASTSKAGEASKLLHYLVVHSDDEIKVEQLAVFQSDQHGIMSGDHPSGDLAHYPLFLWRFSLHGHRRANHHALVRTGLAFHLFQVKHVILLSGTINLIELDGSVIYASML